MGSGALSLRASTIIKHLVKSSSTVELAAAGEPLDTAIMAGSIMFLLAFRIATEGIIRTLKWVGGAGNAAGQDLPPTHQERFAKQQSESRKKFPVRGKRS